MEEEDDKTRAARRNAARTRMQEDLDFREWIKSLLANEQDLRAALDAQPRRSETVQEHLKK